MAEHTNPNAPVCPACGSRNCRFNMTEQKNVCNRCGHKGTREEFKPDEKD